MLLQSRSGVLLVIGNSLLLCVFTLYPNRDPNWLSRESAIGREVYTLMTKGHQRIETPCAP